MWNFVGPCIIRSRKHAAANLYIVKEHSGTLNTSVEVAADDNSTTIFVARKRALWNNPPAHVSSGLGPF